MKDNMIREGNMDELNKIEEQAQQAAEEVQEKLEEVTEKAAEAAQAEATEAVKEVNEAIEEAARISGEDLVKQNEELRKQIEDLNRETAAAVGKVDQAMGVGRSRIEQIRNEKIELKLESSETLIKAREEVKKKYEKDNIDLKDKAAAAVEKGKEKAEELGDKFKETSVGEAVLGDDGKLDKEDFKRYGEAIKEGAEKAGEKFKESSVGKAILGEDGKFDKEDVERIAKKAEETGKKIVEKIKDIVEK